MERIKAIEGLYAQIVDEVEQARAVLGGEPTVAQVQEARAVLRLVRDCLITIREAEGKLLGDRDALMGGLREQKTVKLNMTDIAADGGVNDSTAVKRVERAGFTRRRTRRPRRTAPEHAKRTGA